MRAEYDSVADAVAIDLQDEPRAERGEELEGGCIVAVDREGRAVSVELLDPRGALEEPLAAAAERFGLDAEVLIAAARAALSAPDRAVRLDVAARSAA